MSKRSSISLSPGGVTGTALAALTISLAVAVAFVITTAVYAPKVDKLAFAANATTTSGTCSWNINEQNAVAGATFTVQTFSNAAGQSYGVLTLAIPPDPILMAESLKKRDVRGAPSPVAYEINVDTFDPSIAVVGGPATGPLSFANQQRIVIASDGSTDCIAEGTCAVLTVVTRASNKLTFEIDTVSGPVEAGTNVTLSAPLSLMFVIA